VVLISGLLAIVYLAHITYINTQVLYIYCCATEEAVSANLEFGCKEPH
jgi:hypothetical protein